MKKIILTLAFISAITFNTAAQNDSIPQSIEQQKIAEKVAIEWLSQLTMGQDSNAILEVSKVPFALDSKKIINSEKELKEFYTNVFKNKGQREFPKVKTEVYGSKYEIIDEFIPINVVYIKVTPLEGKLKDNDITVVVEISGDNGKVIGFRD